MKIVDLEVLVTKAEVQTLRCRVPDNMTEDELDDLVFKIDQEYKELARGTQKDILSYIDSLADNDILAFDINEIKRSKVSIKCTELQEVD